MICAVQCPKNRVRYTPPQTTAEASAAKPIGQGSHADYRTGT